MTKALSAVLLLWNVASILSFVVIRPKIQHHAALLASPFDSYHASLSRPPSNNNETANIDHKVSSASSVRSQMHQDSEIFNVICLNAIC